MVAQCRQTCNTRQGKARTRWAHRMYTSNKRLVLFSSEYHRVVKTGAALDSVQVMETCEQVRRVADMRAEAFYEDSHFDRFISTYKKKFSDVEYERLMRSLDDRDDSVVGTLVALDQPTAEGTVLGCVDVLKASSRGSIHIETDKNLDGWYYMKNVVVDPAYRRQGIARQMLLTAEERICSISSDARGVFVHVELSNVDAVSLYMSLGYEHEDESVALAPVTVGVVALLSKAL